MTYDILTNIADNANVKIDEFDFPDNIKGLYIDGNIAINKRIETSIEKSCILAEELGHYYTSTGNILDLNDIKNVKQELKARAWGFDKQIGLNGIIAAYENRCTNLYEMADFLNVTEEYLQEALKYYRNKYGIYVKIHNYCIYFNPNLHVIKYF